MMLTLSGLVVHQSLQPFGQVGKEPAAGSVLRVRKVMHDPGAVDQATFNSSAAVSTRICLSVFVDSRRSFPESMDFGVMYRRIRHSFS